MSTASPVLTVLAFFSEETNRNMINSKVYECQIMITVEVKVYVKYTKTREVVKLPPFSGTSFTLL